MRDEGRRVLFIVGPTSSGKSAVAVFVAERLNGEILSCDSMQVYKDMDVITHAPGSGLLRRAVHHLIGIVPPEEEFNAARFVEEAGRGIDSIISRGRLPIVAGGTGLYMKALIDGIFPSPPKDESLRRELRRAASEKGRTYLYRQLGEIDPETAARLHPNDLRRIIRALEVYRLTGRTIHEKKTESEGISRKYDCRIFVLNIPRKLLYARVDAAVDEMFEKGVVEEVKRLQKRRLSLTAGKALGVGEITAFLRGETSLEKAKEELKKNTRKYAKRQLTWFRADRRVEWIDADRDAADIAEEITGLLR
ncbi:MAG: tRNA (adenosine(37)-N6)-dimethylallyltransferase MiaA [Candidatus Makaraimicrobium thalassicum]|nr:MAG: tRNA (adenosine(37)-N6)-dimethylallyltransferase MiaA [Candidatus Omnitrophota bacterium]